MLAVVIAPPPCIVPLHQTSEYQPCIVGLLRPYAKLEGIAHIDRVRDRVSHPAHKKRDPRGLKQ